jgi:hypothetical protein
MSYEYVGTNTFLIEARYINSGADSAELRDANFNFAWIDFANPLTPTVTAQPLLSIIRQDDPAQISWVNGIGYTLQKTSELGSNAVWSDLGTANPQSVAITSNRQFFRLIKK